MNGTRWSGRPRKVSVVCCERLGGGHPQVQEPRQRQVHVGDLVEVEPVVEAPQRLELVRLERQRRAGAQLGPLLPIEASGTRPTPRRSRAAR